MILGYRTLFKVEYIQLPGNLHFGFLNFYFLPLASNKYKPGLGLVSVQEWTITRGTHPGGPHSH